MSPWGPHCSTTDLCLAYMGCVPRDVHAHPVWRPFQRDKQTADKGLLRGLSWPRTPRTAHVFPPGSKPSPCLCHNRSRNKAVVTVGNVDQKHDRACTALQATWRVLDGIKSTGQYTCDSSPPTPGKICLVCHPLMGTVCDACHLRSLKVGVKFSG